MTNRIKQRYSEVISKVLQRARGCSPFHVEQVGDVFEGSDKVADIEERIEMLIYHVDYLTEEELQVVDVMNATTDDVLEAFFNDVVDAHQGEMVFRNRFKGGF